MGSIHWKGAALLILLLSVGGCKREPPSVTGTLGSSLIFDNASPEVREALASPVDFRINDDNFGRWEEAQSNLEALPRSALATKSPPGGNVVDRAVSRLESSPYTRTAIERTGLSVREFVLETIALAQATEVARTGKSLTRGAIPRENFQFVQRYTSRALYSRSRVSRADNNYGNNQDVEDQSNYGNSQDVDGRSEQADAVPQLQLDERRHQAEMSRGSMDSVRNTVDSVRDTVPIHR